jgi:hypothetical protein
LEHDEDYNLIASRLDDLENENGANNGADLGKLKNQVELLVEHNKVLMDANNELYQAAVKGFLATKAGGKRKLEQSS